jgi:hypothetical protein
MSAWSNNDNHNAKPKFNYEREVTTAVQIPVFAGNTAGNNIIKVSYNDGAQNNVANIGIVAGQYVYFWAQGNTASNGGQAGNGVPGLFASNTQVLSTSGNTITLSTNLFGPVTTAFTVEFDTATVYNSNKPYEVNYNQNTVLVTATRLANAVFAGTANGTGSNFNSGLAHVGWNLVTTGTGGRAGRVQVETLVVLANSAAMTIANTISGNTSNSLTYFAGV